LGNLSMLEAAALVINQPTPEAARLGVYVFAAIFGLMVCGVVSVVKELREEVSSRS
jgi:hypothetical protein